MLPILSTVRPEPSSRACTNFLVAVPGLVDDVERCPLELAPDDDSSRPSLGQMLKRKAESGSRPAADAAPRVKSRMKGVRPGRMVAYAGEVPKRCRVGKVLSISEDQRGATVHVFEARTNHRLQVVWQAA